MQNLQYKPTNYNMNKTNINTINALTQMITKINNETTLFNKQH